jgi:hypothetical protein
MFQIQISQEGYIMENTEVQTTVEARRSFLIKVAYTAPAVMALGALGAPMSAHESIIRTHRNNGFGNGDQTAPGNSATNNGAENYDGEGKGKKGKERKGKERND